MGCNSSLSIKEAENKQPEKQNSDNENKEKANLETIEQEQKDEKKNESEKDKKKNNKKDEKNKDYLNLNKKVTGSDKENKRISTEENKDKDVLSNVLTTDGHKLQIRKENWNGVTLMKGIEECFSEDLTEDEILQLVEDALGESIVEDKKDQVPGTITSKQAKAIAHILYTKIRKKDDEEDDKSGDIDIKNHPELKGVNIKIGVSELTKDVIKNIMFNGQKVDDCQIDLTYANLTKDNNNLKALSIQILP